MTINTAQKQVFSVSQLNRSAKDLLETYLPLLWVEGEISNFSRPSSGHWYFSLKDQRAQVRCAMFRNRNLSARIQPKNGDKVLIRGKVSLYEGRGDFQLIAEHMEAAGTGDLQQQFELLKAQLHAEGLFKPEHKKAIPSLPKNIVVITSATGAAIHDILHVLKRRAPGIHVKVLPVSVQGAEAAPQIVKAIAAANKYAAGDLIILGRGGGSLEDLWAFNEESVARAIFASAIPIISAVGHEVDFSISDFVADQRAPTPSAAAEMASPNTEELLAQLIRFEQRLTVNIKSYLRECKHRLSAARAQLQHPSVKLQIYAQRIDQVEMRLVRVIKQTLSSQHQKLINLNHRHIAQNPARQLMQHQNRLTQSKQRLSKALSSVLANKQQALHSTAQILNSLSPLGILERGFSILTKTNGDLVREPNQVSAGETLSARMHRGELELTVKKVHPKD